MNTITISRAALAACLPAVGVREARKYLEFVRLTRASGAPGVMVTATDGSRIHVVHDSEGRWEGDDVRPVLLDRHQVKATLKGKGDTVRVIREDRQGDGLNWFTATHCAGVVAEGLCGSNVWTYPSVARLFPDAVVFNPRTVVNPEFLADAVGAARGLFPKRATGGVSVATGPDAVYVFTKCRNATFAAVIMGVRNMDAVEIGARDAAVTVDTSNTLGAVALALGAP